MRIHVTKTNGEQIFGSLNIGKLKATNIIHISGNPCFLNEKGELVYCSLEMLGNINERLGVLNAN